MSSTDTSDYRRQKADECWAKAWKAATEKERAQWLDLANLWLAKSDQGRTEEQVASGLSGIATLASH
jgi:hypothetical protein